MQTITMTRRANAKMAAFRDELNRIGRGVGSYLATPGTAIEYVGWGPGKDADHMAFRPRTPAQQDMADLLAAWRACEETLRAGNPGASDLEIEQAVRRALSAALRG